jgi:hypothetical protein
MKVIGLLSITVCSSRPKLVLSTTVRTSMSRAADTEGTVSRVTGTSASAISATSVTSAAPSPKELACSPGVPARYKVILSSNFPLRSSFITALCCDCISDFTTSSEALVS